jgi:hypothetical protein
VAAVVAMNLGSCDNSVTDNAKSRLLHSDLQMRVAVPPKPKKRPRRITTTYINSALRSYPQATDGVFGVTITRKS